MAADEWVPPSKKNPARIDCAGLGIPSGSYVLPAASEFWDVPDGTDGDYAQMLAHFHGEVLLADLPAKTVAFMKEFFGQQVAERRDLAMTFFANNVPRRYATAQPNSIAQTWARAAVTNPEGTRSLLVVGPTGTGKTHYAYSVLRAVAETGASTRWAAYTAADLYARLRPRSGRDSEAEFESIAKAGVLFVDDLAAAKLSEWTEEVTYRLVNHRYEQCLPAIFTSNVPPAQLRDALGERIASRLTEMCERVVLKGDDRRKGMAA